MTLPPALETPFDVATALLLLVGSAFSLIGGIGILRFPDFFSRMHAGGITDTMGAGAILVGLAFQSAIDLETVKLAMILFFMLVTSPTAAHALARAALNSGLEPQVSDPEPKERPSTR